MVSNGDLNGIRLESKFRMLRAETVPLMESLRALYSKKFEFLLIPLTQSGVKKNHEDDCFPSLKIPSSSVFVLALKFPQISQNAAKSCVVSLQKKQLFVLKNHDFCKNELKYQSISYKRACEKADLQFFKEQKFVKANSKKISISFYPTAICK